MKWPLVLLLNNGPIRSWDSDLGRYGDFPMQKFPIFHRSQFHIEPMFPAGKFYHAVYIRCKGLTGCR